MNLKSIVFARDVKIDLGVVETGEAELKNTIIKAKAYHEATGLPVLCNDSGLIIGKLAKEGQPGVFVRGLMVES